MSDTYVPMISSGTAGPLGVLHLPRLWQKVSLESQGKLAAGYPGIGRGYDAMTCAALGLEENAVQDYIQQNKPTYPQFEAWVKEERQVTQQGRRSRSITPRCAVISTTTRRARVSLGRAVIADDASAPKDAVNLNNLDDWHGFHQAVLK